MPGMVMASYPSVVADELFYRACLVVAVVLGLGLVAARRWVVRVARDGPPPDPGTALYRNILARWLGALWLLDGLLQLQPLMATRFVGGLLAPLIPGQSAPVAAIIEAGVRLCSVSPIWFNVGAAYLQLCIGLSLLFGQDGSRLRRGALWASLLWGVVVWSVGEALGSLFDGGSALLGSPGSVLLYMAGAALVLMPDAWWRQGRPWRILPGAFAAFFALMAFLQWWPPSGWWDPGTLSSFVGSMGRMPQPAVFAAPLLAWAKSLGLHPVLWNAVIGGSCAALAGAWLAWPRRRATVFATAAWTLLVWYWGQDFGVLGGKGTDPNTGAILLVYALLWARRTGIVGHAPAGRTASGEATAPATR